MNTSNVYVPAVVGVPLTVQVAAVNDNPGGSDPYATPELQPLGEFVE